ncbi:MAG: N-acetylglucosamine-6-phosphate deacetylase, partial [Planctomycetota bacterium]
MRYVDLQINGLAGIDLNSIDLPTGAWHAACLALGQDGTSNFLPTLITDSVERLSHKLKRLGELVSASTGPSEAIPLG